MVCVAQDAASADQFYSISSQLKSDNAPYHFTQTSSGIHWYHIAVPGGKFGSRVGVTLNTGQPLSLTQVMVMSDMTTQ